LRKRSSRRSLFLSKQFTWSRSKLHGNQGREGGFSNNNKYSQGWRKNQIKILGGIKIVDHPTNKVLSSNNPYILELLKDWKI